MSCFAPECSHSFYNSDCKLLRFPTDFKERKKWIKNVRRLDKAPSEGAKICNCHFVDGKRENGPTIFAWNSKNVLVASVKRKRNRQKKPKPKSKNTVSLSSSNNVINSYISDNEDIPIHTNIEEENISFRTQIRDLGKIIDEMKKQPFGMHCIENDTKLFSYYTGLSKQSFDMIVDSCTKTELNYFLGWKIDNLDLRDQFLITLMKLRLNLEYQDLAVRFNATTDTINNVILTFINLLHSILYVNKMTEVSSKECTADCRIIVGYPEFDSVMPLRAGEEEKPSKNYKNTLKGLLATNPNGTITYCSLLYSQSTANKLIKRRSGIENKFKSASLVFVDEHPISKDTNSVSDYEAHLQAIERMRDFGVLTFIPKPLFTHSSKIFQLCAALTNISNVQLKRIEELIDANVKHEEVNIADDSVTLVKTECVKVICDADSMNCNDFVTISTKSEVTVVECEDDVVIEYDIEL